MAMRLVKASSPSSSMTGIGLGGGELGCGTTAVGVTNGALTPTPLIAVTRNVYAWPVLSPWTVHWVAG
jgi:hypothetical protein